MSGRRPPLYCTFTLIAMQGHQQKGRQNNTKWSQFALLGIENLTVLARSSQNVLLLVTVVLFSVRGPHNIVVVLVRGHGINLKEF